MDTRALLESLYREDPIPRVEDKFINAKEAQSLKAPEEQRDLVAEERLRRELEAQKKASGQKGGIDPQMLAGALRMFGGSGGSGSTDTAPLFNSMFGNTGSGDPMFGSMFGEAGNMGNTSMMSGAAGATGWIPMIGGAINGLSQGFENAKNDPNMSNHKDGFGEAHDDWRAQAGGGVLGGVLGYFGGPVGSAVAGPVVKAVHPAMEKVSRNMVKFGDSWGGVGGAMMMDPMATITSGKYGWGDIAKGAFLGPMAKWLHI